MRLHRDDAYRHVINAMTTLTVRVLQVARGVIQAGRPVYAERVPSSMTASSVSMTWR
jgi:hypothetical protein